MITKRFLRFRYAAIRRYGEGRWSAADGYAEINPAYTVDISSCEKGVVGDTDDYPFILELSNGTKFLCFLHDYGMSPNDVILSVEGEEANSKSSEFSYGVASNIDTLNKNYNCERRQRPEQR